MAKREGDLISTRVERRQTEERERGGERKYVSGVRR
jgi:hypothetical protein